MTYNNFLGVVKNIEPDAEKATLIANDLYNRYTESHRHWHSIKHIEYLLKNIPTSVEGEELEDLSLAILFHDAVYDISRKNNEELSANIFLRWYYYHPRAKEIADAIIATKSGQNLSPLATHLNTLDRSILEENDMAKLLQYEGAIASEFLSFYSKEDYLKGRVRFLMSQTNPKLHVLAKLIVGS